MTTTEAQLSQLEAVHRLKDATSTAQSHADLQDLIRALDAQAPSNTDPQALDEVITSYTERFDRLKFLFLEQESKEQFLRLVLEQNTKEINKEAILKALEESNDKKKDLEVKKAIIDKYTSDIEGVAKENYEMIGFIDEKTGVITDKITEIERKKAQIAQLRAELQSKQRVDTSMTKLQEQSGDLAKYGDVSLNNVQDVQSLLQTIRSHRESLRSETATLERTKNQNDDRINRDRARVQKLNNDKTRINKAIEGMKRLEGDADTGSTLSQQKKDVLANEEKVLLLMKMWPHYSNVLRLNVEDRHIVLVFKDFGDVEVNIEMEDDITIKSVSVDGLDEEQLKVLVGQWNKESIPLHAASKAVHSVLTEFAST